MADSGPVRLRVMSYNVHMQQDDVAALAAVVRGAQPDVVIVQEAPRKLRWRTKCAQLASDFGMVVAAGGLPALDNLLLTTLRVRVHDTRCIRLPFTPGRHMRGAAFARCSVARVPFAVAGSHLSVDAAERCDQAVALKKAMSEADAPLIFAGDINESAGGTAWRTIADGLVDPAEATGCAQRPTFSCRTPRERIDAFFVDPRIAVLGYQVLDSPEVRRASDHFPIVADLGLPV